MREESFEVIARSVGLDLLRTDGWREFGPIGSAALGG